jgi:hypothetical protein
MQYQTLGEGSFRPAPCYWCGDTVDVGSEYMQTASYTLTYHRICWEAAHPQFAAPAPRAVEV